MTPRKFNALANMHVEFTNPKKRKDEKQSEEVVVDDVKQIPGF